MKKLIASVLFACVWVGPVLAEAPSKDPTAVDTVKQLAATGLYLAPRNTPDAAEQIYIAKANWLF